MKRHTLIVPLDLPRLTDKAAAQLIELLHQLFANIEYHYAQQAFRYHKRQQKIRQDRPPPSSESSDPPF